MHFTLINKKIIRGREDPDISKNLIIVLIYILPRNERCQKLDDEKGPPEIKGKHIDFNVIICSSHETLE